MHNIEQKTSKAKWKERMTKWTKSHVLTLGPTQDFKCVWWKLKIILEMMLEKEWSCNFLKCSLEVNLFPSLQIAQKGEHKPPHLGEKVLVPTSNVFIRGTN